MRPSISLRGSVRLLVGPSVNSIGIFSNDQSRVMNMPAAEKARSSSIYVGGRDSIAQKIFDHF